MAPVRYIVVLPCAIIALAGVIGVWACPAAQEREIPLSQQIEGLGLEPRVAYLRYLLESGGRDPEVYFQLGVTFHENSQYDSAEVYYRSAIRADRKLSKAYVNLGVLYDEQGKLAEALAIFERALAVDPDDLLAFAHAGFIRFQIKDYETAWGYLRRAMEIDPGSPQAHFYLAIFFWESNMFREAMREWERVIDLEGEGYLAMKARENIVLLQKALNATNTPGDWKPAR